MCMMLDLDACIHAFVVNPDLPARVFRNSINNQRRKLVVGGHLKTELLGNGPFRTWYSQALLNGRIHDVNEGNVQAKQTALEKSGGLISNDVHIIALAQASGCRILCSLDGKLQQDFRNRQLLDNPTGKIYPFNSSLGQGRLNNWLSSNTRSCRGEACLS